MPLYNPAVAEADTAALAALVTHEADTTSIHGITDTSVLLTTAAGNAAYVPLAGGTSTGEQVAPSFKASGKTGATATPLILAGGTASGAPASGAHLKGELVLDDTGAAWFCTVAGTPGTWVAVNKTANDLLYEALAAPTTEQVMVQSLAAAQSNVNWSSVAQSSADYGGGERTSSAAQNDEVIFGFVAQAGTYTLSMFHKLGPSRGIYSIYIDGVLLGTTVDGYNASITSVGGAATITNITVAATATGRHTIKFKMEAKNASSSNYLGCLTGTQVLTRTGA